jgi:3-hydroxyisobutyrate dehydrogenase
MDAPYLLDLNRTDVADDELAVARKNFAIVQTKIISMDWVFLHYKGNRRAFFDYQKQTQTWMQT